MLAGVAMKKVLIALDSTLGVVISFQLQTAAITISPAMFATILTMDGI